MEQPYTLAIYSISHESLKRQAFDEQTRAPLKLAYLQQRPQGENDAASLSISPEQEPSASREPSAPFAPGQFGA